MASPCSLVPTCCVSCAICLSDCVWSLSCARVTQIESLVAAKPSRKTSQDVSRTTQEIYQLSVDLEYAVRAWTALERCYLPPSAQEDVRIQSLRQLTKKLKASACGVSPQLARLAERVLSLLDLCQITPLNRNLYMNAFGYHYLKKRVFAITDPSDYTYLDRLFVRSLEVAPFGPLFLQAIATSQFEPFVEHVVEKGLRTSHDAAHSLRTSWRIAKDSEFAFPDESKEALRLSLRTLVLGGSSLAMRGLLSGTKSIGFNDQRLVEILEFDEDNKHLRLCISDTGLLGGKPSVHEVDLTWKGKAKKMKSVSVKTQTTREWTDEDRKKHSLAKAASALEANLNQSGLV